MDPITIDIPLKRPDNERSSFYEAIAQTRQTAKDARAVADRVRLYLGEALDRINDPTEALTNDR